MTDKLRDSMHARADEVQFAPVDLGAVVGRGSRTVRRRRGAAVAAGAAAVLAVAALVTSLTLPDPETRTEITPADPYPVDTRSFEPMAAVDRTVVGAAQGEVVLETAPERLMRNGDVLVYSDADARARTGVPVDLHVWAAGTTTDVGRGFDLSLDQDGHVAAWLDDSAPPRLVVLDTRTMATRTIGLDTDPSDEVGPDGQLARLHDVDGGTAYLSDARGGVALDLVTGDTTAVEGYVVDAENGVVVTAALDALDTEDSSPGAERPALTVLEGDRRTPLPATREGVLSPDGRWFATSDRPPGDDGVATTGTDVMDTATGTRTALDTAAAVSGDPIAVDPGGWLDDDSLTVFVTSADGGESLLVCEVPSGSCQVALPDVYAAAGTTAGAVVPIYPDNTAFDRR